MPYDGNLKSDLRKLAAGVRNNTLLRPYNQDQPDQCALPYCRAFGIDENHIGDALDERLHETERERVAVKAGLIHGRVSWGDLIFGPDGSGEDRTREQQADLIDGIADLIDA